MVDTQSDGAACPAAATEYSGLGNAVVRYGVVVAYRLTRSADSGRRRKGRGRVQITQFWTLFAGRRETCVYYHKARIGMSIG